MSRGGGIGTEWRRCNTCGRIWFGAKSRKSCTFYVDGERMHCGSGRLIRYPERDAEVQSIISAQGVV